jgi:hypothetical protein
MSTAPDESSSPWLQNLSRDRGWLVVIITAVIIFAIRFHLRHMPLERDEGEYAYAGQLILHGIAPYKEAYNMKLPGTYAAYAVLMAVFGQSPAGIHFGLALVNAFSIILIFLVGRRLLDDAAGAVAAVVFGLVSTSPAVLGMAGHATHFVVLPALAGMLLLLKSQVSSPKSKVKKDFGLWTLDFGLFFSGLLFGLAFLMKQQGVFFGIFGLLYVAFRRLYEPLAVQARIEKAKKTHSKRSRHRTESKVQSLKSKVVEGESSAPKSSPGDSGTLSFRHETSDSPRTLDVRHETLDSSFNPWTATVPPIAWNRMMKELAVFAAGLVVPYVLICLLLLVMGDFHQFVFWTITYAKEYASARPLVNAAALLSEALKTVIGSNSLLLLLPWVGLLTIWWDDQLDGNKRFFLLVLLFCSAASTAVGLYFRAHYFITLLPVLALLAGAAVSRAVRLLRNDNTIELCLALPVCGLFFFGIVMSFVGNGSFWFTSAFDAVRTAYSTTLFSETLPVAQYIKTNSTPNERIAVLGSEPEIYFYARRRGATGYIYIYPLMESQPFAKRMQDEMISEIEHRKPQYVVYVDGPLSWLATTNSEQHIYEWWRGYWASNLDLIKSFDFVDEPDGGPTNTHQILLLKRKVSRVE